MSKTFKKVISSPIRWAGSKKKLLNEMLQCSFRRSLENYVEPFLGSGVVLINVLENNDILGYKNFYVNDSNENIISLFLMIKDNLNTFINRVKEMFTIYNNLPVEEKRKMYNLYRDKFNEISTKKTEKAIIFYFLTKTCFNGVYRENSKGMYNVPFGRKDRINFDVESLKKISKLIQHVHFYNLDYRDFFKEIGKKQFFNNSFVYCDPPYLPEDSCITKRVDIYTKESFNHYDFVDEILRIKPKYVMISMSHSHDSDVIYEKGFLRGEKIVDILRVVNPNKVFSTEEYAYKNFID